MRMETVSIVNRLSAGKTANLQARLAEELKDERPCIWLAVVSVEAYRTASQRNHPVILIHGHRGTHFDLKDYGTAQQPRAAGAAR